MNKRQVTRRSSAVLTIGALGVVFGDIGTSPLYAMQAVFSPHHGHLIPNETNVYGVISLVFWSVTLVVAVKYLIFVLRADNDGEGGILALTALIRDKVSAGRATALATLLGIIGASLFFGDSVITPAISVMSAIEGISLVSPSFESLVVPIGAVILTLLFVTQSFGTGAVAKLFGPIMTLWFITIAGIGLPHTIAHPDVLAALLPHYALEFFIHSPIIAFIALGAVVLTITGAEALYADMGHFGKRPIQYAWFFIAYPALILNYLGQGSLVLYHPEVVHNPFFQLAPGWATWPVLILATLATIIASQAVISGAFSMSRQAERLGYFPRLTVRHTSATERGQVYLPAINWLLYGGVMTLLLVFQSSGRLASAYGLAVTGTLLLTSTLFLFFARRHWHWSRFRIGIYMATIMVLELLFFGSNVLKIVSGGWIPILIGTLITTVMLTWHRGITLVQERHSLVAGKKQEFLKWLKQTDIHVTPGTAVYLRYDPKSAPLALRANTTVNHSIHHNVILVRSVVTNRPYVHANNRVRVTRRAHETVAGVTIFEVKVSSGFLDEINIPRALNAAVAEKLLPPLDQAYYFVSRSTITAEDHHLMPAWQRRLFVMLYKSAARPTRYFKLPFKRTVTIGTEIKL